MHIVTHAESLSLPSAACLSVKNLQPSSLRSGYQRMPSQTRRTQSVRHFHASPQLRVLQNATTPSIDSSPSPLSSAHSYHRRHTSDDRQSVTSSLHLPTEVKDTYLEYCKKHFNPLPTPPMSSDSEPNSPTSPTTPRPPSRLLPLNDRDDNEQRRRDLTERKLDWFTGGTINERHTSERDSDFSAASDSKLAQMKAKTGAWLSSAKTNAGDLWTDVKSGHFWEDAKSGDLWKRKKNETRSPLPSWYSKNLDSDSRVPAGDRAPDRTGLGYSVRINPLRANPVTGSEPDKPGYEKPSGKPPMGGWGPEDKVEKKKMVVRKEPVVEERPKLLHKRAHSTKW